MKKISKNYYKGNAVKCPIEIYEMAKERKSLYHKHWGIKPAAVFLNMQLCMILELIADKKLFHIIRC